MNHEEQQIYVYVNTENYRKIRNNPLYFPDFLATYDYANVEEAKKGELGRIRNIHFITEVKIDSIISVVTQKLMELFRNSSNNIYLGDTISELLSYFDIIRGIK